MLKHKTSDQDLPHWRWKRPKCGPSSTAPHVDVIFQFRQLRSRSQASCERYQFEDPPLLDRGAGESTLSQDIPKSSDDMTLKVEKYEAYSWAERNNIERRERRARTGISEGNKSSARAEESAISSGTEASEGPIVPSPRRILAEGQALPNLPRPKTILPVGRNWRKEKTHNTPQHPSDDQPALDSTVTRQAFAQLDVQDRSKIMPPLFHQENASVEAGRLSLKQEQALVELDVKPFCNPNAVPFAANTGARKNTFPRGILPSTSYSSPEPEWYHNTGARKGSRDSGVDPNTKYTGAVMVFPVVDTVRKGRTFWPDHVIIAVCDKYEEFIDKATQTVHGDHLSSIRDTSRDAEIRKKSLQISTSIGQAIDVRGIPETLADLEDLTFAIASSIGTVPDPAMLDALGVSMFDIETEMPDASEDKEWNELTELLTAAWNFY